MPGVELYAEMFLDVSLAAYLLSPPEPDLGENWRKFVLSALVEKYLREPYPVLYKEVLAGEYPEVLYQRLVQDAHYVWRLGPILVNGILADETLLQPYWELEILLTSVLAEMECRGIGLDRERITLAFPRVERAMDVLASNSLRFMDKSSGQVRKVMCGVFSTVPVESDRNVVTMLMMISSKLWHVHTFPHSSCVHGEDCSRLIAS